MKISELLQIITEQLSDLSTLENPDFRLEQVEKKGDNWDIVCSYLVPNTNKKMAGLSALAAISNFEFARLYKRVKINSLGEIEGIYMYKE